MRTITGILARQRGSRREEARIAAHDDVDLHAAQRAVVEVIALERAGDEPRRRAEAGRMVAGAQIVVDGLGDVVAHKRIVFLLGLLGDDARGIRGVIAADVEEPADIEALELLEDAMAVFRRGFPAHAAERRRRRVGDGKQLLVGDLAQIDVIAVEDAVNAVTRTENLADEPSGLFRPCRQDGAHERGIDHHRRTTRLGDHHVLDRVFLHLQTFP